MIKKEHVGKRVLLKGIGGVFGNPLEVTISEISPSGDYAKIKSCGFSGWHKCADYQVCEILSESGEDV